MTHSATLQFSCQELLVFVGWLVVVGWLVRCDWLVGWFLFFSFKFRFVLGGGEAARAEGG